VLIAALALFPVVSASDDRIRLTDLSAAPPQQVAFDNGHNMPSAALEDPEHGQTAEPFLLTIIVCLFLIAHREQSALSRWFPISALGRAPPQLA